VGAAGAEPVLGEAGGLGVAPGAAAVLDAVGTVSARDFDAGADPAVMVTAAVEAGAW
jgi:hypothetical protein